MRAKQGISPLRGRKHGPSVSGKSTGSLTSREQDRSWRLRWGLLASALLIMVLPVLAWSAYALHTFGSVIPNTNAAKRGGTLLAVGERLVLIYGVGFPVTLALLPWLAARIKLTATPPAIAVLLLWPLLCIGFYLADHTIVQTRYSLLSMPCLTLAVLWWTATTRRDVLFKGMIAATLLTSVAVVLLTVVPHVANKKTLVRAYSAMSAYVRDRAPADQPVAVYAIGLLAFESRHPLIDLGGIIQPAAVRYLSSGAAMLRWAKLNHAHYFISPGPPQADAVPLAIKVPFLGWTLDTAAYRTSDRLVLYRLPAS